MSGAQLELSEVKELCDIAQLTVEIARKVGADVAEVVVRAGSELNAKVRLGEPELVQEAGSRGLGLRVLRGGRRAVTYTSDLRREALEALCAESVTLADLAEVDDMALPPDPSLLAKTVPDLDLYDAEVPEVDAAWALRQAKLAEDASRRNPKVTNSEGATWWRRLGAAAFATSGGFVGGYRGSSCGLYAEPLCDDNTDPAAPKKRNGSWWTASRFLAKLADPESVGLEAARRTIAKLGSRKVETQECAVVFDPEVGRQMIGTLFSVANGSVFWRNSSYLVGKEGQQIASELVTLVDDPLIPRAQGSRPFDGDGLPTRKNMVVDKGVLCPVLCDVYSARKLGRESNGASGRAIGGNPGPTTSNLMMQPGSMSRDELLRSTRRGLYVTSLMGFGFNPITGDFSRGALGFWIENGELTFPVSGVTIAANFDEILKRIDAVADDLQLRTSTEAPTFRVSHMMLAGTGGASDDE